MDDLGSFRGMEICTWPRWDLPSAPLSFTRDILKMTCAYYPVLEGNPRDPPGRCMCDFSNFSSWKLLVLCSISMGLMGRRSSHASLPGMPGADLHAVDTLLGGSTFAPAPPSVLSLIKFWLSMKLNLQIVAFFFVFLYIFFISFIIMHISYAHILGTAGFEEGKLAKNNHLGWRKSTI